VLLLPGSQEFAAPPAHVLFATPPLLSQKFEPLRSMQVFSPLPGCAVQTLALVPVQKFDIEGLSHRLDPAPLLHVLLKSPHWLE